MMVPPGIPFISALLTKSGRQLRLQCSKSLLIYDFINRRFNKKNYQPVSRILCPPGINSGRLVIIYLVPALLPGSCCLPLIIERAALYRFSPDRSYTWHYSTQGLPASCITAKAVSSYLTFSPLSCQRLDGNFLWHFLCGQDQCFTDLTTPRSYRGVLLFAVRTFLSPASGEAITRLIDNKGKFYFIVNRFMPLFIPVLIICT